MDTSDHTVRMEHFAMILLSKAIEGYYIHADARQLSEHTIRDYRHTFEKFLKFQRDTPVDQVTRTDIRFRD